MSGILVSTVFGAKTLPRMTDGVESPQVSSKWMVLPVKMC
jgi:hypothetical protein